MPKPLVATGQKQRSLSKTPGVVVGGSDDSGNGVSIQARSYLQLSRRQHKVLQEAESVRDLTCSDRPLGV